MVKALIARGDYDRAIDHLTVLSFQHPSLEHRVAAQLWSTQLYEALGKGGVALRLLAELEEPQLQLSPSTKEAVLWSMSRILVKQGRLPAASQWLPVDGHHGPTVRAQLSEAQRSGALEHRWYQSPLLFGSMSAILPGSGQIAAGRWLDAVSSWLMIALPGIVTYAAHTNDEHVLRNTAGFVTAIFYLGNISSAYRLQQRNLAVEREQRLLELSKSLYPAIDVDLGGEQPIHTSWPDRPAAP